MIPSAHDLGAALHVTINPRRLELGAKREIILSPDVADFFTVDADHNCIGIVRLMNPLIS